MLSTSFSVWERLEQPSIRERVTALWRLLVAEIEHLESTKAIVEDVAEAIQFALHRDREEFNDRKRERYVKVIGNAMRSDTPIEDVVSFIQTIEQLTERDLIVLRVINRIMNRDGDWKPQSNPGIGEVMKIHPGVFSQRSHELSLQIATALGQQTDGDMFSREEGYMICARLQGFGLAHEIDISPREIPVANYSFRLSVQGVRLLKLLGEDVPNFERYCETSEQRTR